MTNSTDKQFQQRPQARASSATGWIIGAIIALLAIAAVWFFGIRTSDDVTRPGTTSNTTTKTNPPEAAAPPPETGTGGSTTAPTPTPAPAPPPVTP